MSNNACFAAKAVVDAIMAPTHDAKYPLPVSVNGPTIVVKHAITIQLTARNVVIPRVHIPGTMIFILSTVTETKTKTMVVHARPMANIIANISISSSPVLPFLLVLVGVILVCNGAIDANRMTTEEISKLSTGPRLWLLLWIIVDDDSTSMPRAIALPCAHAHAAKYPFPVVVNGPLKVRKHEPTKVQRNSTMFTWDPNLGGRGIEERDRSRVMTGMDMAYPE